MSDKMECNFSACQPSLSLKNISTFSYNFACTYRPGRRYLTHNWPMRTLHPHPDHSDWFRSGEGTQPADPESSRGHLWKCFRELGLTDFPSVGKRNVPENKTSGEKNKAEGWKEAGKEGQKERETEMEKEKGWLSIFGGAGPWCS